MSFNMMKTTRLEHNGFPPEALGLDELSQELRRLRIDLSSVRLDRDRAHHSAEHQADEWGQGVAEFKRTWGDQFGTPPTPDRIGQAREQVEIIDEHIAALIERRAALADALRVRVDEEEAALARMAEDLAADERAHTERLSRLRELTAPLLAFEHYATTPDGLLPLAGTTEALASGIVSTRTNLAQRSARWRLARATHDEIAAEVARDAATVAVAAD